MIMGIRSCLRGCLRRCAGKSSSDGNVPNLHLGSLGKPAKPISAMCSRFVLATPFGLVSASGASSTAVSVGCCEGGPINLTGTVLALLGQSADGRWIDGIASSDIGLRLTVSESTERFLPLMRGELARSTETHATSLSAFPAVIGAGQE